MEEGGPPGGGEKKRLGVGVQVLSNIYESARAPHVFGERAKLGSWGGLWERRRGVTAKE